MLIDYTYFFGDCSIGQLSESAVQDKINWLIQQYEPEYLQSVLGYALYTAFLEGLTESSVDQKWLDLLNGKEYVDQYNRAKKWKGLIQLPVGSATVVNAGNAPKSVVVGRNAIDPVTSVTYDPTPGSDTTTIPPAFVGKNFTFMQRGFGPLRPDEFTIAGNQLTLTGGIKFNNNDTFFYFGEGAFSVGTSSATFKLSPIAYYVYYMYQKNQASKTGGTGEGIVDTQNSMPVSPKGKMITAWNKMVYINRELYDFLYINKEAYAEWWPFIFMGFGLFNAYRNNSSSKFLRTINSFGI